MTLRFEEILNQQILNLKESIVSNNLEKQQEFVDKIMKGFQEKKTEERKSIYELINFLLSNFKASLLKNILSHFSIENVLREIIEIKISDLFS